MAYTDNPISERVLIARSQRLNQPVVSMTAFSGWKSLVEQEVAEVRARKGDIFIGGEDVVEAIEVDAQAAVDARKAI